MLSLGQPAVLSLFVVVRVCASVSIFLAIPMKIPCGYRAAYHKREAVAVLLDAVRELSISVPWRGSSNHGALWGWTLHDQLNINKQKHNILHKRQGIFANVIKNAQKSSVTFAYYIYVHQIPGIALYFHFVLHCWHLYLNNVCALKAYCTFNMYVF